MRPHLVDFLEAATEQKIKIALVSSASRWMIEKILDKLNLNKYFDFIISKEDVSKHKPDPEAFLLAIRKLDATHKQTLVFEDSEAGVKAAQAAGCSFVFVRHDFNSRHDNRNSFLTIDTFADLQKAIL